MIDVVLNSARKKFRNMILLTKGIEHSVKKELEILLDLVTTHYENIFNQAVTVFIILPAFVFLLYSLFHRVGIERFISLSNLEENFAINNHKEAAAVAFLPVVNIVFLFSLVFGGVYQYVTQKAKIKRETTETMLRESNPNFHTIQKLEKTYQRLAKNQELDSHTKNALLKIDIHQMVHFLTEHIDNPVVNQLLAIYDAAFDNYALIMDEMDKLESKENKNKLLQAINEQFIMFNEHANKIDNQIKVCKEEMEIDYTEKLMDILTNEEIFQKKYEFNREKEIAINVHTAMKNIKLEKDSFI